MQSVGDAGVPGTLAAVNTSGAPEPAVEERKPLSAWLLGGSRSDRLWRLAFAAALVWWVWNFTHTSLRVHHGLGTSAYDYGLYDQGVWLLSRLEAPFITLMGRNLFGDHVSLILVVLVPFYWFLPGAGTLFTFQSIGLAGGAIPVYLLARRLLGSEPVAVLLGVAFLANPALGGTAMEQFHPDSALPLLFGFAVYFAVTSRWGPYAVFVVLALLVKEDVALLVIPLGVWVAFRRDRTIGLATLAFGVGSLLFGIVVLFALSGVAFPNAWRIPFGGVTGLVAATLSRPGEVFRYLLADGRPWYLWQLTAPFAGVFLFAPEIAAVSVLVIVSNVISTFGYQHMIGFHYTAPLLPGLALGTVWAISRIPAGRFRRGALTAVVVMSLWTGYLWGEFPFSRAPGAHWPPDQPSAVWARDLMDLVPDDAVVSAHWSITPHLAHRREIYMFPTPFYALLYGPQDQVVALEGSRLPQADGVEYVFIPTDLDERDGEVWDREQPAFQLVASNEAWQLWRRR